MNDLTTIAMHRRRFLQAALTTGAASMVPTALRFGEAHAASPVAANEGILVLVTLGGGNDGLNTVIPVDSGRYRDLRQNLAITRANGALDIGNGLALHPSLPGLKRRFDQGMLAIVQGVGYSNPNLSHFDSMGLWMSGWGGAGNPGSGWVGRWLDAQSAPDSLRLVSIGGNVPPHLRGVSNAGVSLPDSVGDAFGTDRSQAHTARLVDLVASYGDSPNERGAWADKLGKLNRETIALGTSVAPAYAGLDGEGLVRDMKLVAKLINADVGVRVFNVEINGFDTHEDQLGDHAALLTELDTAIDTFFATLGPAFTARVTVMTFSEFGRRPESNGSSGTDHGTAAPLFVAGQGVKGGMYSTASSLTALDEDENLVASCDFRQVYATMLSGWLGASADPILGKHYDTFPLFRFGPGGPSAASVTGAGVPTGAGYWTVSAAGGVKGFGAMTPLGDAPAGVKIVSVATTPARNGYWLATADGTVYPFGAAAHFGDMHGRGLASPIVDMCSTPTGLGYWMLGRDGGVFSFGDAAFHGSTGNLRLAAPVVGMAACPSGRGYWFVAEDGGIFAFGPDAKFYGSTGNLKLVRKVVSMAPTPTGKGYWLVAADGGVFAFGDAAFQGSTGNLKLNRPIIGLVPTTSGKGYWFVAEDGGVFAFGDAPFLGSSIDGKTAFVAMA
jgi:uncharacterized protein (DUF1501 family)/ribosomal protein L24E